MIVTCDVVEAAAGGANEMFVELDSTVATTGFGKSVALWAISAMLVSSAIASDTIELQPVGIVVDSAVASDKLLHQGVLNTLLVERAVATDILLRVATAEIIETGAAADSLAVARTMAVLERADADDDMTSTASISAVLTSAAVARDKLLGFNDLDIADSAVATDSLVLASSYALLLVDAGLGSDTVIVDGAFDDLLADRAVGASFITSRVDAFTAVTDTAAAQDKLVFSMAAMAWVMNTETFAMARYTSLPFKSMAMVGGRVLALGDTGLYEMAGDTDDGAPVHASVTTGRSMLGSSAVKRVPSVYINGAIAGQLDLTAVVYGAHKGAFTYSMVSRESGAPRGHRIQLGRGLASVYWKFTLANKDGARFDIDTVMADVAASTTRRI